MSTGDIDDKELMTGLKKKDESSYSYLINKYEKVLLNGSFRITYDREASMEIVQDTFMSFYENLERFKNDCTIITYLYRVMMNKSIDFLRRKIKYEKISAAIGNQSSVHENDPDVRIVVNEALVRLPVKLRVPLLLAEYEKMKYEEISLILKIPLNTVRTRLFNARKMLLGIFKSMGVEL